MNALLVEVDVGGDGEVFQVSETGEGGLPRLVNKTRGG